jgi:hypothetical protein
LILFFLLRPFLFSPVSSFLSFLRVFIHSSPSRLFLPVLFSFILFFYSAGAEAGLKLTKLVCTLIYWTSLTTYLPSYRPVHPLRLLVSSAHSENQFCSHLITDDSELISRDMNFIHRTVHMELGHGIGHREATHKSSDVHVCFVL